MIYSKSLNRIIVLLTLTLLVGCVTSKDVVTNSWVQKRKYRPGLYLTGKSTVIKKENANRLINKMRTTRILKLPFRSQNPSLELCHKVVVPFGDGERHTVAAKTRVGHPLQFLKKEFGFNAGNFRQSFSRDEEKKERDGLKGFLIWFLGLILVLGTMVFLFHFGIGEGPVGLALVTGLIGGLVLFVVGIRIVKRAIQRSSKNRKGSPGL